MLRRYEGIQHIIDVSDTNKAVIKDAIALANIFSGHEQSQNGTIAGTNTYRLGWSSIIKFTVNAGGFTEFFLARFNMDKYICINPGVIIDQVVTRGVSSCSVVHLYEGKEHIFVHTQPSESEWALQHLLDFVRGKESVHLDGSFHHNDKAEQLLTSLADLPNVKINKVMGRGNVDEYDCLIHSEIGLAISQNGGSFFGDYNVARNEEDEVDCNDYWAVKCAEYNIKKDKELDLFEWPFAN